MATKSDFIVKAGLRVTGNIVSNSITISSNTISLNSVTTNTISITSNTISLNSVTTNTIAITSNTISLNSVTSNAVTASYISSNGGFGTTGQVLTSGGSGTSAYWSTISTSLDSVLATGNTTTKALTVGNITANSLNVSTNVAVIGTAVNVASNGALSFGAVAANGGLGTSGQVLTSTGSGTYWSTLVGVNTSAQYTFTNTITFSGTATHTGPLNLPVGNTAQRPANTTGTIRYNVDTFNLEYFANTSGATTGQWVSISAVKNGLTASGAAVSGYQLKQDFPAFASGTYYIAPTGGTAVSMYVDMTADGGGYDFYQCTGCSATSYNTDGGSCPTGTRHFHGRSVDHWAIIWNRYGSGYATTCGGVYKTSGGGNYTGCIMRNPASYGSGCSDWRVNDGGKWWLRNSTTGEPNGDYNGNGWLSCGGSAGSDIGLNDGGAYSTGSNYICSTNAKP